MKTIGLAKIALFVLLVGGAIGLSLQAQSLTAANSKGTSASKDPWPPFTMVYKDEHYDWVAGTIRDSDTYRYSYKGHKTWTQELIESTRDPRAVGTKSSYDAGVFELNSVFDGGSTDPYTASQDLPVMATWWLVPMSPEELKTYVKYQLVGDDGKNANWRQTETVPCSSLQDPIPTLCANGEQTFERHTDKFLSLDFGIPMEVIESTEGRVSNHITITELTFAPSPEK